jgi:SAM-dependent methyltransferase
MLADDAIDAADAHWTTVFAAALRGEPCRLHGVRRRPVRLKVAAWQAAADSSDLALLAHCIGPTLDIGCGPGRLTEALALTGRLVLGIDVVPEAIRQARFRGIEVLLRDVFEPLPGEGRWNSALLADGNIGIGGNAVALLRRVHGLLAPDGAVVVDLAPPGTGATTRSVRLECAGWFSESFPWAVVGPESVAHLAGQAGFTVAGRYRVARRSFAVLEKTGPP